jgi:excisionase family DNA binding protein
MVGKTVSVSEMAKICKVSTETIRRWIDRGAIKSTKTLGGHRRITLDDFLKFLNENNIPYDRRLFAERRRILVVDDEDSVVDMLKEYIEALEEDFEMDVAKNGFQAGVKVTEDYPDVIILDIIMPGMDGIEVCERLKADKRTREIKVVAITGYASQENVQRMLDAGAALVLRKPFTFEEFQKAILSFD